MPRKINITVLIMPEQDEALRALSKRTRVSACAYVRDGIDLLLQKYAANEQQKSAAGGE